MLQHNGGCATAASQNGFFITQEMCHICSVSNPDSLIPDPDSLIPDPDPAFLAEYQSGSRVLMTK
jgi:hypothetical protein